MAPGRPYCQGLFNRETQGLTNVGVCTARHDPRPRWPLEPNFGVLTTTETVINPYLT
nr:hypothetical protein SHINE37_42963 [Rhizobiaceae bacterium]